MADRRNKNTDWYTAYDNGQAYQEVAQGAILATLMDLRDELQAIRNVLSLRLNCYETMAIPHYLRDIARNTTKKRRPRKKVQA